MSNVTLTGKTMQEVREYLDRTLPPEAYGDVPGRSYLTSIQPMYLRESLTDCFGAVGEGWWTEVVRETVEPIEGGHNEWYGEIRLELFYTLYDSVKEYISRPITGFGGDASKHREDVLKGAFTNALGAAGKELLWQTGVYKGEDVLKSPRIFGTPKLAVSFEGNKPTTAKNGSRPPLAIDDLKRKINLKVERLGDYAATSFEAEEYVRQGLPRLFPDSDDAAADVDLVLQFLFDVDNVSDLYDAQVEALRSWIGNANGDPSPAAIDEAEAIVARAMIAEMDHPEPVAAILEPVDEADADIDLTALADSVLLDDPLG